MTFSTTKKHFGFITLLMLVVTSVSILGMLLAYLSFYVSPESVPLLAFAGLAYPYILVFMLLAVLFWTFYRIKFALIPLVIILLGWNYMGRLMVVHSNKQEIENRSNLVTVVSYNIQNFLKVNTSTTRWVTDFDNEKKITNFIKGQNPDILCLQEMLNDRPGNSDFADRFGKTINCAHHYYQNYYTNKSKKIDALATFTRFPIIDEGNFVKDDKTFGLFTDLKINGDTIRVYNLHLASIHFRAEDYRFWTDMDINQEQEKLKEGSLKILGKMKLAFIRRAQQVAILNKHMKRSPYPIIVCGDFNDTPNSYAYHILSDNKNDAHLEQGSGLGTTYAGKQFPAFRIDYILYDKSFSCNEFHRYLHNYSDHYPIACRLQVHRRETVDD